MQKGHQGALGQAFERDGVHLPGCRQRDRRIHPVSRETSPRTDPTNRLHLNPSPLQ